MSDMLSQDDLDNLLSQDDDGDVSAQGIGGDEVEELGSVKDYDSLRAALDFFNDKAGTVISNVLNREASLSVLDCEAIDAEKLLNTVPAPVLMVTVPLEGGVDGSMYLLVPTKNVAVLADLMLMGDGSAEYNEDHKDALGEMFNQIVGNYTTALGERLGSSVSSGDVQAQEFDYAQPPFALEKADMALLTLAVADQEDASVGLIIPDALSADMMEKFAGSGAGESESDSGGVGLSGAELDDLSKVASDFTDSDVGVGGFEQAGLAESSGGGISGGNENVQMLLDVELDVSIELGRTDLSIKRILELSAGSIVELDRMAGEPVDLLVNNKVVAKGEVVVVDENFGIRIVSLISPEDRIKSLR